MAMIRLMVEAFLTLIRLIVYKLGTTRLTLTYRPTGEFEHSRQEDCKGLTERVDISYFRLYPAAGTLVAEDQYRNQAVWYHVAMWPSSSPHGTMAQ